MTEGDFNFGARRTSRIELQFSAQISTKDPSGKAEVLDAQALVVNMHGAKLECKRPFQLNEEVDIFVYTTGKSAKGKVAWTNWDRNSWIVNELRDCVTRKRSKEEVAWTNWDWHFGIVAELRRKWREISPPYSNEESFEENGHKERKYEFAVELYEPQDLWTFLVDPQPQDWEEWKMKKGKKSRRKPEPFLASVDPKSESMPQPTQKENVEITPVGPLKELAASSETMDANFELANSFPDPNPLKKPLIGEHSINSTHCPACASGEPKESIKAPEIPVPSVVFSETARAHSDLSPGELHFDGSSAGLAFAPDGQQGEGEKFGSTQSATGEWLDWL